MSSGWHLRSVFLAVLTIPLLSAALLTGVHAQSPATDPTIIVPQSRTYGIPRPGSISVTKVDVRIEIRDQSAATSIDFHLTNSGSFPQETKLIFPIQNQVVVKGLSFSGLKGEGVAEVMERDAARRIYDSIVARMRDPALLEFIGYNLIQTSVFPIPPRTTEIVTLSYEELLPVTGNRLDYTLLRSESVEYGAPWHISGSIRSSQGISTVYSPSHELSLNRISDTAVDVSTAPSSLHNPGMFRLSCLLGSNGMPASFYAYPEPGTSGGFFLLLAGLPLQPPGRASHAFVKREVTLVLDRSGSMNGEKLEQVREAALQIVSGLENGEYFNVIIYNESIDVFADEPVKKTLESMKSVRDFIEHILARGGTNIHDALAEALRQKPVPGTLPIVLFLTDGLPTVGNTSEKAIRNLVIEHNPNRRRVFTFGVGVDVNAPLLEKIALETRAASTFVLPSENVELKVGRVFDRLSGPVLTNTSMHITGATDGDPVPGKPGSEDSFTARPITDVIPAMLPDLFAGDQMILMGRYRSDTPIAFTLSGDYFGEPRTFRYVFDPEKASPRHGFVARLWAARKIAVLTDAIRQLGGDDSYMHPGRPTPNDPRVRELVEEIVRLSTKYGILTEYTAFLAADKETVLPPPAVAYDMAESSLRTRGMKERSGMGAVSQSINADMRREQKTLNYRNEYRDENMNRVVTESIQQVNDLAFYRTGNQWVDSRLALKTGYGEADTIVEFGSDNYRKLLNRLISENRQGVLSLNGDILLEIDGKTVLVRNP